MDLQKLLEKLPQQYQDWGSALMSSISEQLTLLSQKTPEDSYLKSATPKLALLGLVGKIDLL